MLNIDRTYFKTGRATSSLWRMQELFFSCRDSKVYFNIKAWRDDMNRTFDYDTLVSRGGIYRDIENRSDKMT